MAKSAAVPAWQRAQIASAATLIGVVLVGALYWAQAIFIPLALAIFLAFLLSPLVGALERRRLGRILSVGLVVTLTGLLLCGLVWLVTEQGTRLIGELPTYTENIKGKIKGLRQMAEGSLPERLDRMVRDITGEWQGTPSGGEPPAHPGQTSPASGVGPAKVVVQPESSAWLGQLPAVVSPVLGPLGALALATVLAVFMLLKREDLRNRFIRLVGLGRLTGTTKAVDDAAERISRFLRMQLIVNGTYGLAWGIGLFIIGVDSPVLWGFLAALLRYIPYIGAPIVALFPLALSLAQFPGWWQLFAVLGLFLILELITANILEPLLFGLSIGVSGVASLIAAAFWAFLWGPIGLILSNPLTVCLVVLGKRVPQLEFFDVLLGDEPALEPDVRYYQRLLARDQDEAAQLVLDQAKILPAEQVYDVLLVPALNYAKRDLERGDLTEDDQKFVLRGTREIVEDLGELQTGSSSDLPGASTEPPLRAKISVVTCPAEDEADRLALEMLQQLLDPAKWALEVTAVAMRTGELITRVREVGPALICIGSLPPGGLAHTRFLCKRLRAHFPAVKIVVGRWGLKDNVEESRKRFQEAGADLITTSLLETRNQLNIWLPVLAHQEPRAAAG